jgi:hypothetical protein
MNPGPPAWTVATILALTLSAIACSSSRSSEAVDASSQVDDADAGRTDSGSGMEAAPLDGAPPLDGAAPEDGAKWPLTLDCVANDPACPLVAIDADAPASGLFHGLADPSMRRDPVTHTLWLAYSWPHVVNVPPETDVSDLHLSHSDDDGETWTYDGPLWTSQSTLNPVTMESNPTSMEVISLAPGAGAWYEVHLVYAVPPGTVPEAETSSWYFHVATAATPKDLPSAPFQRLAFGGTNTAWPTDKNLASLSPDVSSCTLFNEPALVYDKGKLYLAAQCLTKTGGTRTPDDDFYAVFSTSASGPVAAWTWSYIGKLAGPAEASALGCKHWVELDLTTALDGVLLATVTPANPVGVGGDVHFGCRVVEVSSLDPPKLTHSSDGGLVERASITATDLTPYGPGACGYEPTSKTGVVLTRKLVKDPTLGDDWSLHATGLHP